MSVSRYETSLSVVNQAAVECGLGVTAGLFASTDANFVLLRYLLNSCGRELGSMRAWRHLLKSGSFTAAAAVAPAIHGVNALATDYDYAIDGTFWNATDQRQIYPADEPTWQRYLTTQSAADPSVFRFEGNAVWLYAPSAGDSITYKYVSRYWVLPVGQTSPTLSASTADTDTLYHNPLLLARLLKLRFMQARGKDTTAALVDFETIYAATAAREASVGVISLQGAPGFRALGGSNFTDGNWG